MRRLLVSLALASAAPVAAQSVPSPAGGAGTRGPFVGADVIGVGVTIRERQLLDVEETNYGGGVGARLGWGLTRAVALVGQLSGARFETGRGERYTFRIIDLGARLNLARPGHALVPYVEGAYTTRTVWFDDVRIRLAGVALSGDAEASGAGFSGGAGAQYFVRPSWSVDAGVQYTRGDLDEVTVGGLNVDVGSLADVSANSARLTLGVTWHPLGAR